MDETVPESRKRLALDTDWVSATAAAVAVLACFGLSGRDIWWMLTRYRVQPHVSWYTAFLLFACIWAAITIRSRTLRLGFVFLGLPPASRLALYLSHISEAVQMENIQVMRVVNAAAFVILGVSVALWLRDKIRYV